MTGLNGRQRLVSAVLSVMQPREKYIKSSGEREERERNAGRRQEGTEDEGKEGENERGCERSDFSLTARG